MHVKILGKRWRLQFVAMKKQRGDCDRPDTPRKRIRINTSIVNDDEQLLEVAIHEMLHAANWNLDEEFVFDYAKDAARVLYKLGFRRHEQ
jgi:hypothetical protein